MKHLALAALAFTCISAGAAAQSCSTSATSLAFGAYQPLTGIPSNSTATVTVTCNPGVISLLVSYAIQIGAGSGGSFAARSMGGTATRLPYQIYTDTLYTQVWGDGTGGSTTESDGYLLGVLVPVVRHYTAYATIPGNGNVAVGSYLDTTMITVIY